MPGLEGLHRWVFLHAGVHECRIVTWYNTAYQSNTVTTVNINDIYSMSYFVSNVAASFSGNRSWKWLLQVQFIYAFAQSELEMQLWSVRIKSFWLVWTNTDIQAVLVLWLFLALYKNVMVFWCSLCCIALPCYRDMWMHICMCIFIQYILHCSWFSYFDCHLLFESLKARCCIPMGLS